MHKSGKKRLQFAYNNVIIRTLNNAFVIESGFPATLNILMWTYLDGEKAAPCKEIV